LRVAVAACTTCNVPRDEPNSGAAPRVELWLAPNIPRKFDGPRTVRGHHLLGVSRSLSLTSAVAFHCLMAQNDGV
jgi:hypothetical protein